MVSNLSECYPSIIYYTELFLLTIPITLLQGHKLFTLPIKLQGKNAYLYFFAKTPYSLLSPVLLNGIHVHMHKSEQPINILVFSG